MSDQDLASHSIGKCNSNDDTVCLGPSFESPSAPAQQAEPPSVLSRGAERTNIAFIERLKQDDPIAWAELEEETLQLVLETAEHRRLDDVSAEKVDESLKKRLRSFVPKYDPKKGSFRRYRRKTINLEARKAFGQAKEGRLVPLESAPFRDGTAPAEREVHTEAPSPGAQLDLEFFESLEEVARIRVGKRLNLQPLELREEGLSYEQVAGRLGWPWPKPEAPEDTRDRIEKATRNRIHVACHRAREAIAAERQYLFSHLVTLTRLARSEGREREPQSAAENSQAIVKQLGAQGPGDGQVTLRSHRPWSKDVAEQWAWAEEAHSAVERLPAEAVLLYWYDSHHLRTVQIGEGLVVGRVPPAGEPPGLVLSDPCVSRPHFKISHMPAALRKHESFVLEDLDSKNQTYVNERPVPPKKRRELKDGDVVRAGHTRLLFLSGRSAGGEE